MTSGTSVLPVRRVVASRSVAVALTSIVALSALVQICLGTLVHGPRVFGDELIYWELARNLAGSGHLVVRDVPFPGYGLLYPALAALGHVVGGDAPVAYATVKAINAVVFSLAAVPTYLIAARVVSRRYAVAAAALAVMVPSAVLTSAVMTESLFYPVFLTAVAIMLRALELPTFPRQMGVLAFIAIAFLIRAQAVVLVPAFIAGAAADGLATAERGARWQALRLLLRRYRATLAVLVAAAVVWCVHGIVLGRSATGFLGTYAVLVRGYEPGDLLRWTAYNLGDLTLYVGVAPAVAFFLLLIAPPPAYARKAELRRLLLLSLTVGAAMVAAVAALSSSPWGLARVHERNLFYLAPLGFIALFAWIEAGMPRPARRAAVCALAVGLLPVTIPAGVVSRSGVDGLALWPWKLLVPDARALPYALAAFTLLIALVFLRASPQRPYLLPTICACMLFITAFFAQIEALAETRSYAGADASRAWIDRAVGRDASVLMVWTRPGPKPASVATAAATRQAWENEFFNDSVRRVASVGAALGDGLPARAVSVRASGCLVDGSGASVAARYSLAPPSFRLDAPVVTTDPTTGWTLYRTGGAVRQSTRRSAEKRSAGASDSTCTGRGSIRSPHS